MTVRWRARYMQQYGLTKDQVSVIGAERLGRMTDLGREIMSIMIRLEKRKGRAPVPAKKPPKPEQNVDRLMQLAERKRA